MILSTILMSGGMIGINENFDPRELLNSNLFLKNYYIFYKHIAPFFIAVLLLFMLSFTGDNVASSVLKHTAGPKNQILVIFSLIISILLYYWVILSEIRHSYLSAENDFRRSLLTAFLGIITCTGIVFVVLYIGGYIKFGFQEIISCIIISVISLLGIGVPMPTIVIELPNYTQGRYAAREVGRILSQIDSQKDDVALDGLCTNIAHLSENVLQNLNLENGSTSYDEMNRVHTNLEIILKKIKIIKDKKTDSKHYIKEALKGTYDDDIFRARTELGNFMPEWRYPASRGRIK